MSNKRHRNNCSTSRLNSPSKRLSGGLTVLERSLTTRCISKKDRDKASLGKAVGKEMNRTTQHACLKKPRHQRREGLGYMGHSGVLAQLLQAPGRRVRILCPVQHCNLNPLGSYSQTLTLEPLLRKSKWDTVLCCD